MPLGSWLVATHYRPQLLRACLETLYETYWPPGWENEVIVAHHEDDNLAAAIAHELGAIAVSTRAQFVGGKLNAAWKASKGELVLVADDDDMQSAMRPSMACAAFESGSLVSGVREFRYLHLENGNVVRWCGRGGRASDRIQLDVPPVYVGTARNYRRTTLEKVGGWRDVKSLVHKEIQSRIQRKFNGKGTELDLGTDLSDATICVQHSGNIWGDRPCVPRGQEQWRGNYLLIGEGHWSEARGFPLQLAERLGLK
jgi:hypothetical protein